MTRAPLPRINAAASVLSILLPLAALPSCTRAQLGQASPVTTTAAVPPASPAETPAQPMPVQGTPAEWVEARTEELHNTLAITRAQEPQFKAFADVMRANAETMRALFAQRAQDTDTTALGRLRWYAQLATAHAEAMQKLVAAFEPLYRSLSETQKKAADMAFEAFRVRMEGGNAE